MDTVQNFLLMYKSTVCMLKNKNSNILASALCFQDLFDTWCTRSIDTVQAKFRLLHRL